MVVFARNGNILVWSEQEGQPVSLYTIDGKVLGSAAVKGGQASIATNMQRGDVVILKVGNMSVKVKM